MAAVFAESSYVAEDAAELVAVESAPLPARLDARASDIEPTVLRKEYGAVIELNTGQAGDVPLDEVPGGLLVLDLGDPYVEQLQDTARLIAERAALRDWSFSFQSESPTGEPWLGPDILDHLRTLNAKRVLVCPVGFVSDHLEIRWDLDVEAAEVARELGIELTRIEMPNAEPAFVRVLAGIVRRALSVPSAA